jgi:hypothetical protein
MVARIIKGKNMLGLIKYNEKEKSAVLYSQYINDAKDTEALTRKDKVEAFQAYIRLNPAISKPTFHVSLNPDPQDKLDDDQLQALGREYMQGMNYGDQPYLIYKHEDIDRVHIHIVSVNIGLDGKAINSSNERYRSEAVRKHLEAKYQLKKAGEKEKKGLPLLDPINLAAIKYGKTDTKSAIAHVVCSATHDFIFPALEEFRSFLNYYQVTVDEVKDRRELSKTVGLFYAIINKGGEKVSARIKASKIGQAVCYGSLMEKFAQGRQEIEARNLKEVIRKKINQVLATDPERSPQDFKTHLARQGLQVVYQVRKDQNLSDLAFIDLQTKTVLNGRTLGLTFPVSYLHACID